MKVRKNVVFLDMDGVCADFDGAVSVHMHNPPEMFVPGFFRNLKVMPGAKEGVQALLDNPRLKVYIATKHTTKTDYSPSEKVGWVREHFPELVRRMFIVTDKYLLRGDYLIDDDLRWQKFPGKFIHFDRNNPAEDWKRVVQYFKDNEEDLIGPEEKAERAYQTILATQKLNAEICKLGVCIHKEHRK